jgi:hypothetical protein
LFPDSGFCREPVNERIKSSLTITTMEFRASFCNPFQKEIIEFGKIEKDKVIEKFNSIDWKKYLEQMNSAEDREVYYSPSLEIENIINKNGLSVSAIDGKEWYIFYKRPKRVKRFFGLSEKLDEDYQTDLTGQNEDDVLDCLNALLRNDLEFLENKIK